MPEHDALVQAYSHLADFPRAGEALTTLKKVASLVKPIMRARRWRVGELAEFYPEQHNLLGRRLFFFACMFKEEKQEEKQ
ncbi:hypothetical protein VDGD_06814 [Verticillium dahliae]|nr:hypothetical protein VDGD_06814 [Verticillium dahliae]